MPVSLIPSFLFYCFINGITPGPANLCSLAAALKYGRVQALRQWRGLATGFALVSLGAVFVTYFLGEALDQYVGALSWIGAAYILWLALHILRDDGEPEADAASPDDGGAPLPVADTRASCNFVTGLLVQSTNVKVMLFCLTALSSFVLPYTRSFWKLLAVGCCLPFTGPLCNLVWLFAGVSLRDLFANYRRSVNRAMATSLVLCAVSLVWQ